MVNKIYIQIYTQINKFPKSIFPALLFFVVVVVCWGLSKSKLKSWGKLPELDEDAASCLEDNRSDVYILTLGEVGITGSCF